MSELTHINKNGEASMVDVGEKEITERTAYAEARVIMQPSTLGLIKSSSAKKGDVIAAARIAGIQAGKRTWELIPLCHSIPIDKISVDFSFEGDNTVVITSFAKCEWKTGIEMEALTAASVAALTVYDMCKAADRGMRIDGVRLLYKNGGKSGEYRAED